MKVLPDSPNLDHLRQQAKDLLAGLRDSDHSATLAGAQASLADQYGFRDWTELKAEVGRRRGSADVADPALAGEIASRYGLGQVAGQMRSVAPPDELGRQWLLGTDRGCWTVLSVDGWIPIVDVEDEVALQLAAAEAGVALATPVRSASGAIVETIDGHPWRVYERLASGPPLVAPVSSTITYTVGRILAKIHRLALPVDRVSPWHASRLSQTTWGTLADEAKAEHANWAPTLAEAIPRLTDLEAIGEDMPVPVPVLCHNTLGPSQVRVGARRQLVVVGWEHAGGQPASWELGDALMHWTINPSGGVNTVAARAMAEGYRSEVGLLPPLDMGMFRGAVISLANYVSGEVHQALNADHDEDRRRADRSVRHLLSHLPSRHNLERLLDVVQAADRV
ncbi:phosphotransferase [Phytoactinopolyspora endophytica]|uniref:phosphotransferase n=1 Tax=Phytoactinopolyspora endophytica TaxID=1642495 RepID=UPI00101C488E|nr:phosphotransferase [Phytoactinopolyspora endophytica]